jgi:hypothetical protein
MFSGHLSLAGSANVSLRLGASVHLDGGFAPLENVKSSGI